MSKEVEILRGRGALAALEIEMVRAVLGAAGIPCKGGRMQVVVRARDARRAVEVVAAALGGKGGKLQGGRVGA